MTSSVGHTPSQLVEVSSIFYPSSSASVSPLGMLRPLEAKPLPFTAYDRQINNVTFDLRDVLLTWSVNRGTSLSPQTLQFILCSSTWFKYERGDLGEEEAYGLVATKFSLDASELGAAFCAAQDSLQSSPSMVALLHELRGSSDIRLFAMSNISAPELEVLHPKGRPEDWAFFERIFTSVAAHGQKPNLGYFRHILKSAGIDPHRTAFVDDKLENIVSAWSLGLKGIIFTSFEELARELGVLVRTPIVEGERYLRNNARQMKSVTDTGVVLEENFAQLLILEATGDPSLVDYIKYPRLSNFFKFGGVLTTTSFPCDVDTTSTACMVSDHFSPKVKNDIMNEILTLKNKDGIIQTYFDVTRPRIDPTVCVNVLTFFYSNGRGGELWETFNWVYEVLRNRAYTNGTLYYYGPDTFLYFLSRLLSVSIYARQRIGQLFAKRVVEHLGADGDALALAMRIHAAAVVDLCDSQSYERLGRMQEADGSWPMGWIYRYPSKGILIGNKGLTTALAVSAIRNYQELVLRLRSFG